MTLAQQIALALYPKREDEGKYPMFLAYRERAERTVEAVLSRQTTSVTEAAREIEAASAERPTERRLALYESILTRLRAQHAEELRRHKAALKVAKDALKECEQALDGSDRAGYAYTATAALAAIDKELKP